MGVTKKVIHSDGSETIYDNPYDDSRRQVTHVPSSGCMATAPSADVPLHVPEGSKGATVVVNLQTCQVAVSDIRAGAGSDGTDQTAHSLLAHRCGWDRQIGGACVGGAIQDGVCFGKSGTLQGARRAAAKEASLDNATVINANSKMDENRFTPVFPEDAKVVALRLFHSGGGIDTFEWSAEEVSRDRTKFLANRES